MASKYGYMAKIGADTSGLTAALSDVENSIRNTSAELKAVNQGLKLEGGQNVENLGKKYDLLGEAVEQTKSKLEQLRKAEEALSQAAAVGTITVTEQKKYQQEIANTESRLRQYEQELANTKLQLDNAGKSTDDATKETTELGKAVDNAGKSAVGFGDIFKANILSDVVMSGLRRLKDEFVDFAKQGIELASDLSEVQNVVDTTFGSDADKINTWAANAATSFGMSELAAKQYTGTLGAMLKSQGITSDSVVELSENLVGLAGDMASFYNLDIETAFEKIRSGISGETEPLKQLGINMSVTNMEAYALAEGIEKPWRKMSQQEQTMLRYKYLLEVTADAQGDFAKTSDSYANQQRIMELNMQNLQAKLGEELLPVVNEFISEFNDRLPDATEKVEAFGKVASATVNFLVDNSEGIIAFAGTLLTLKGAFGIANTINSFTTSIASLGTVMGGTAAAATALAAPIGAIAVITGGAALAINAMRDSQESAQKAANEAAQEYAAQQEIVSGLQSELEEMGERIDELNSKDTLTITDEQELIKLQNQSEELRIQIGLEERLLELKKEQAEKESVEALMTDNVDSAGSIAKVERYIARYNEYQESIENYIESYNDAVESGDTKLADYYADGIKTMQNQQKEFEADALESLNQVIDINEQFKATTEEGKAAKQAVADITKEVSDLFGITLDTAAQNTANTSIIASYYENLGKASAAERQSFLESRKLDDEAVESGLKELEEKYKKHQIVDSNGNQDEAAYMAERKKFLQEHVNQSSEIWWKYWDEIKKYESDSLEKQKKQEEKAAEERKKVYADNIDDQIDELKLKKEIDESYTEEMMWNDIEIIVNGLDKQSEQYKKYNAEILKGRKKLADDLKKEDEKAAEEELKKWGNTSKELSKKLESSYKEIVKEKQKAKDDLLDIDLSETVTDSKGKDVNVLTDLNAEIKKMDKYQSSLEKLKKTDISDSLMEKIMGMNYEDGSRQAFIDTLLGLSPEKLQLYYSDWERFQAKAGQTAQDQISGQLDDLNEETANTVSSIFGSMPESAYEEGAATAQSYIQGIIDNMGGLNDSKIISSILGIGSGGGSSGKGKNETSISLQTPITINLNDKEYIKTTIGDLISAGARSGGNTFNL